MPAYSEVELNPQDRILILVPHPDDETIATGGVIQKAVAMGLPIHVAFLTYGDNNETSFIVYRKRLVHGTSAQAMGLVRHDEGVAATGVLGLRPDQLTFLGYPDFRCLTIWGEHWGDCAPCESMFTRTSVVPYPNALRPGTPYRADEVLADIEHVLRDFAATHGAPTKVFVSHPADHNPDHLALYLFTRVALWNLSAEMQPELLPFLVHHPAWPQPEGLNPGLSLEPPGRLEKDAVWQVNPLTPEQVQRKAAALQQHKTQYRMSAAYLNSFMRANELFGDYADRVLQPGSIEAFRQRPDAAAGRGAAMIPAELTNTEKAKWVGVERRAVWLENDSVVIAVEFSRPLANNVGAMVYLFGYRPDRPFSQMPKIQVRLTENGNAVLDQARRLAKPQVELRRSANGFVLRAPLAFLGDPRWIMGSVRTYATKVPLDWIAWRIVGIPQDTVPNR
jgi:LmbE family N-acetylglucosaminyl deacetylase